MMLGKRETNAAPAWLKTELEPGHAGRAHTPKKRLTKQWYFFTFKRGGNTTTFKMQFGVMSQVQGLALP